MTSLSKSHPDVRISYSKEEFCTLHGTYSKVQAALAQILGHSSQQLAENKDSDQPAPSGSMSVQTVQNTQESEYQSRKHHKQRDKVHGDLPSDERNSSSHRDLTPAGYGRENATQTDSSALQVPEHPNTSQEDFSLIVDADMFQYLQKRCKKEYQSILTKYGVDVVDMTNQGLTTLFLQVVTGGGESGQEHERLTLSRKALSRLYQENETKIRHAHLPKSILSPRGGLQKAMENLSIRLPKLLLNEDENNIYIIGSSSDVSEAKQSLLLDLSKPSGKKDDVASLLRFNSYDSSSLNPADEERVPPTMSSTEGSPVDRIDQIQRSEEDESKGEGARRYKLAARFKDSGIAALGSRPTDFTLRGLSSPSRQTRLGPMLGYDVLSETAGSSGERVSRALAQNTGQDILFKGAETMLSGSLQNKTPLNSNLVETRPKSSSPLSTTQSGFSESTPLPPAGSGSTVKRASSFSGTPQQKAQVMGQKSKDDTSKSPVSSRGRSSSFSTPTGRDVYYGDVRVSRILWKYIKEAYCARVDDLTSDVQMKESRPEGGYVTVTIKGANSSKVSSCQQGLQKLIDSVNVDFSLKELLLSELGVADPADETLQACCAEVRSRLKKVTIQIMKKSLLLVGPEQLCSNVAATLWEVFSGDLAQTTEQQAISSYPIATFNPSTYSQIHEEQFTHLHCNSNPWAMLETQPDKAGQTDSGQERGASHKSGLSETEFVNGSFSHSLVTRDPVIKEKVKITGTAEIDGQKTETVVSPLTAGHGRSVKHVNGVGPTTAHTDKDTVPLKKERTIHSQPYVPNKSLQQGQTEIQNIPEESRSALGEQGSICVCGKNGTQMTRTECGVTLCSKCLDTMHANCRVCHESVMTPQGIQGKMSFSRLQISLPGYSKDLTIKITYSIPDGIQAVRVF